jgi:TolB protein
MCFLLVSATSLLVGIGMVAYSASGSSAGASLRVANGLIAFTRQRPGGSNQIVVMRSDGKRQRTLSTAAADDLDPAWSPNGRKIAFTNGNSDLVVMNADGRGKRIVSRASRIGGDERPQWSPDGKRLVFDVDYGGGNSLTLFVINVDGTGKHKLGVEGVDPDWSPDGSHIAFSDFRGRVAVVGVDGHGLRELTKAGCSIDTPTWSPDSRRIAFAFASDCFEPPRIDVMNIDGKGVHELTPRGASGYYGSPGWSPDGTKIVFSHGPDFGSIGNIYVMNADGSHVQKLTTNGRDFDPSWQPLPRKG